MADTKLSALTALAAASDDDVIYIVDGGVSKKITVGNLRAALGQITFVEVDGCNPGTRLRDLRRRSRFQYLSSAYRSVHLLGGPDKTFVLGASGHIAGVVNPPAKNRRSYWAGDPYPADPDAWLGGAKEYKGSWWPAWSAWLDRHAGGRRKAPKTPGNVQYRPIEPAPGRYVKQRIN